jgi:hypothetical protein
MIPTAPLPTAADQHALVSLRTRRLALLLIGSLLVCSALLLVLATYKATARTADRLDPLSAETRR